MFSQGIWDQVAKSKIQSAPSYSSAPAWGQAPVQDILGKINSGQYDGLGSDGPSTNQVYSSGGYQAVPWMGGHAVYKALDPSIAGDGANQLNGTPYDIYDAQGNFLGSNKFDSISSNSAEQNFAIGAAMLAGPFAAAIGGAGAAAGAAGAGGAGGGAGAGAGALTGGGFVGEGALSGIGAWDAAMAGAAPWTGAAGAGAGALSGGGFVGEGAASGIPAWDGALSAAGGGGAAAGGGSFMDLMKSGASSLFGGGGGAGGSAGGIGSMLGGSGGTNWLGLGATALGALAGSKGQDNTSTQTNKMDPRLDPYLYGDLFPRAQGLLNSQFPQAQQNSAALNSVGMGLLGTDTTPNMMANPYITGRADDIQRRTQEMLGANNMAIQGNSVMNGTLGGDRQGIAQGTAAAKAADYLQGNLASLYGNAYESDANRALSKITLGSGLLSQGMDAPWMPIQGASNTYRPYSGLNSSITSGSQQGGGWMGALGGGLGAAQMAKNFGWF